MINESLQRVRSEALALSEAERAALALELVCSLDAPAEHGVSDAWDDEICARLDEIEAGRAESIDRDEFARRLRSSSGGA